MEKLIGKSDVLPSGQNFRTSSGLTPESLRTDAITILSFLNERSASGVFSKVSDWLQHDGFLFDDGIVHTEELMEVLKSIQSLEDNMPNDTFVRFGLFTEDRKCYFRFFSNTEDLTNPFRAEYDITLDSQAAIDFEKAVMPHLNANLIRENSPSFYSRISKQ